MIYFYKFNYNFFKYNNLRTLVTNTEIPLKMLTKNLTSIICINYYYIIQCKNNVYLSRYS